MGLMDLQAFLPESQNFRVSTLALVSIWLARSDYGKD